MKEFLKVIGVALLASIVGGAVVAHYSSSNIVNQYTTTGLGSPVGTTFGTAKVAQINWTLSTSATSTAILNTDAFDRIVDQTFYSCTGVGTSRVAFSGAGTLATNGLVITAATSSAALIVPTTNVNLVMANILATTTAPVSYMASTTVVGVPSRIWASGSYMNFEANATNTAACTVGVYYHGS